MLDARAAPDAERWAADVAERLHHLLVDEPSRHDDASEPSRWFG